MVQPCCTPQIGETIRPAISRLDPQQQPELAPFHKRSRTFGVTRLRAIFLPTTGAMPEMVQRESLSSTVNGAPNASLDNDSQADPHQAGSLPPWVHINESESSNLLPPETSRPNTRHYKPPPPHYKQGRKWDHLRSAEPPLLSAPIADHQVRWIPFMQSGPNPVEARNAEGSRLVTQEWMDEHMPDLSRPWVPSDEADADGEERPKGLWLLSPERQERTVRLFWVGCSSCWCNDECNGVQRCRILVTQSTGLSHSASLKHYMQTQTLTHSGRGR